jgi:small-conductance mechanosensitive channel
MPEIKKRDWKEYFKTRLYIASFILALVGWFILFVFLFGQFFENELLTLEKTIETSYFLWGLRIFIIILVILLIKGKRRIKTFFINKSVKWTIYIVYIIGALGWLAWFISLFL